MISFWIAAHLPISLRNDETMTPSWLLVTFLLVEPAAMALNIVAVMFCCISAIRVDIVSENCCSSWDLERLCTYLLCVVRFGELLYNQKQ